MEEQEGVVPAEGKRPREENNDDENDRCGRKMKVGSPNKTTTAESSESGERTRADGPAHEGQVWDWMLEEWVDDYPIEDEDEDDETEPTFYHYQDSEAFLAALELYNREQMEIPRFRVVFWECRVVCGRHSRKCGSCWRSFGQDVSSSSEEYYLTDRHFLVPDKMCLPCMDNLLNNRYGVDKTAIKTSLATIRKRQRPRDGGGLYEELYPNYPCFLKHCKENDEELADQVSNSLAQRHADAMEAAINRMKK